MQIDFAHCHCHSTPVSNFGSESFPRVRALRLYVGQHDPEETHPRSKGECHPDMRFWNPFFDGTTFPNCTDIEIRHYWASPPHSKASLDLTNSCGRVYDGPTWRPTVRRASKSSALPLAAGSLEGLEKVERIFLEYVPELDATILMQLLGNPKSTAANLTSLELRFCNLSDDMVAQLLHHAPPNLRRLVLLCRPGHDESSLDAFGTPLTEGPAHLCPLLRRFGRNLRHLEFGASHVCRQLFFDQAEMDSLRRDGITTCLGSQGGSIDGTEQLDAHAIRHAILECRRRKRAAERQQQINAGLAKAMAAARKPEPAKSLFGGAAPRPQNESKIRREIEHDLDEAEEKRKRVIEGSKRTWFRRFIAFGGLCCHSDTWKELQIAADMEEAGILWVLVSK